MNPQKITACKSLLNTYNECLVQFTNAKEQANELIRRLQTSKKITIDEAAAEHFDIIQLTAEVDATISYINTKIEVLTALLINHA